MAKDKPELASAVAEAEKAVASIKDSELRRAAFEKILEHLLGSGSQVATPRKGRRRKVTRSTAQRVGPQGRVDELIEEGFFKKPRTLSDVKAELANRGYHIPRTSLSGPLQALCRQRRLRRQKGIGSDNSAFGYTNW